ncbi:MAG: tRNA pseudouridine(55) synthase TruB [Chloroflexi bacterium]|nr:tRNA pseudouridine(55) synthase TruB [Chloroflexota bacterium]
MDKPVGPTSHDVVAIVRRLSGAKRVGHGGTLDPFAAGVLPVFLGRATRMVEYHLGDEKAYRAVMVFGARSTTDDIDGELTPVEGVAAPSRAAVETALAGFVGTIEQRPPDYSAVRIAGRHAYELARHGETPELKSRTVTFHEIRVIDWDERDPERPAATVEMRCSAGTYVRALARDCGEVLGTGAYLGALVRTASGPFRKDAARPLEEVRGLLADGRIGELLLPVDTGLDAWPQVSLDSTDLQSLLRGQVVRARGVAVPEPGPGGLVRVLAPNGALAAMARLEGGRLHPEKVLLEPGVAGAA